MKSFKKSVLPAFLFFLLFLFSIHFSIHAAFAFPVTFTDSQGNTVTINEKPTHVVSLVPTITEIIFRLGASDALTGITHHTTFPGEVVEKTVVGGFFEPSIHAVEALNPDIIFISSIHQKIKDHFAENEIRNRNENGMRNRNENGMQDRDGKGMGNGDANQVILIELSTASVDNGIDNILLLGKIFDRENEAIALQNRIRDKLTFIDRKITLMAKNRAAAIPSDSGASQPETFHKKRVMRIMGRDSVMTPGNDSFQNELIRLAGGISPDFDKKGSVVQVTKKEWMAFNPEVIYGCGKDKEIEKIILNQPGWKDVDAVKNHRIYYFPCELTCRAATYTGYFIQWLSASIYGQTFSLKENRIYEDGIINSRQLNLQYDSSPDYVQDIRIDETRILDFINRSLVIDFKEPMTVLSTLEGQRQGIRTVINHYTPPQNWLIDHSHDLDTIRQRICSALGVDREQTSLLMTGADMNNLSVKKASHKALDVYAFVTAGVSSNAMRMSRDRGDYYEPGTINIILMTNMQLSPRAMTRSIITATEAKTAALLDMDIRSSYADGACRATGTGTDNVLLIQGQNPPGIQKALESSGGHTKLGELIATAVYQGVKEAIYKQNGLSVHQNIFQRLKKRGITIYSLIANEQCDCGRSRSDFVGEVEELLLSPEYEGFMAMALALSDDYDKGLIRGTASFEQWCRNISVKISGKEIDTMKEFIQTEKIPPVIKTALNALLNGVYYKDIKTIKN